jgi:hypothetical protein
MAKQQPATRTQTQQQAQQAATATRRTARATERSESIFSTGKRDFIFERSHFILFGIGLLLVLGGLAAMTGGQQPDPNQWDESIVYSPRRITLAPMMILAGFGVVIYGIFKKSSTSTNHSEAA